MVVARPQMVLRMCTNRVLEFRNIANDFMPSISNSLNVHEEWKFPRPGLIKINVDTALGMDISFVGIVARDHFGKLSKCWIFKGPTAIPEVAEAFGMVKALEVTTA
ncbi:hypothetical protein PanWU01x14_056300 [Parasponia andersonii]|uniref:Uncharacterized protein n=1 Tax=Parasponia andersonii TaxID=3476 RepID=A0A2P5DKB5_PARAD|nr:hypothetical protein PanWU01x14_056300 [Parasponia andersonii]